MLGTLQTLTFCGTRATGTYTKVGAHKMNRLKGFKLGKDQNGSIIDHKWFMHTLHDFWHVLWVKVYTCWA